MYTIYTVETIPLVDMVYFNTLKSNNALAN